MLERLIETADLRKIHDVCALKKTLHNLFDTKFYVELLQDKQIMLGLRDKKDQEVIHTDDPNLLGFLRMVRDDMHHWQEIVKIKRSAHKQLFTKFTSSAIYEYFNYRLDKNFFKDTMKVCKKIHDYNKKLELLHDRLQGVFLVSGKKKEVTACFDDKNCVITTKVPATFDINDFCWVKEVKYATVLVVCPDDNHLFKYLKENNFEKLVVEKKKCKNIWVKNYK